MERRQHGHKPLVQLTYPLLQFLLAEQLQLILFDAEVSPQNIEHGQVGYGITVMVTVALKVCALTLRKH